MLTAIKTAATVPIILQIPRSKAIFKCGGTAFLKLSRYPIVLTSLNNIERLNVVALKLTLPFLWWKKPAKSPLSNSDSKTAGTIYLPSIFFSNT